MCHPSEDLETGRRVSAGVQRNGCEIIACVSTCPVLQVGWRELQLQVSTRSVPSWERGHCLEVKGLVGRQVEGWVGHSRCRTGKRASELASDVRAGTGLAGTACRESMARPYWGKTGRSWRQVWRAAASAVPQLGACTAPGQPNRHTTCATVDPAPSQAFTVLLGKDTCSASAQAGVLWWVMGGRGAGNSLPGTTPDRINFGQHSVEFRVL